MATLQTRLEGQELAMDRVVRTLSEKAEPSGSMSSPPAPSEPSGEPLTVFLTSAGRIKKATWVGGDWVALDALYWRTFASNRAVRHWTEAAVGSGARAPLGKQLFMLRDREYGIFYEDFDLEDLYDGAVIEVNDPANFQRLNGSRTTHHKPMAMTTKPTDQSVQLDGPLAEYEEEHLPEGISEDLELYTSSAGLSHAEGSDSRLDNGDRPPATFRAKMWEMLDDPTSSTSAMWVMMVIMFLILFSTCTFLIETMPQFYEHNPEKYNNWFIMEAICIGVFTIEFVARVFSTPDINSYFKDFMNVIDVAAIVPFYMELMVASVNVPGLSMIRMVRLVRVFRLFKVSRGSIVVFARTMAMSSKPLFMLVFFTSIAMVLFSSLMCYAERGIYDEEMKMWMRLHHYMCPVVVRAEALDRIENRGQEPPEFQADFMLDSGHDIACERIRDCDWPGTEAEQGPTACFMCPYTFKRSDRCQSVYEESPFESIPAACWWCIVTMTTVGYGDMYPTGWIGKLLGCIVMMFGILVIALPITVIGSNFAVVYKAQTMKENQARRTDVEHKVPKTGLMGRLSRGVTGHLDLLSRSLSSFSFGSMTFGRRAEGSQARTGLSSNRVTPGEG